MKSTNKVNHHLEELKRSNKYPMNELKRSNKKSRNSKKIKKSHRKTHKKSNKNNDEVRKTLWEKIEKGLDKKRMEFKIKKRSLTIELIISCMHMVIESIKEEHAEQDHTKQDQLIEYFMEAFNQEIILNEQIIQSGSYTRSWEYVASAIIINTTDPIQFISKEELSKISTVEIREYK